MTERRAVGYLKTVASMAAEAVMPTDVAEDLRRRRGSKVYAIYSDNRSPESVLEYAGAATTFFFSPKLGLGMYAAGKAAEFVLLGTQKVKQIRENHRRTRG